MQRFFLTIFITLFSALFLFGQEVLVPLGINQALSSAKSNFYTKRSTQELKLPFREDFSTTNVYPDPAKFVDKTTFINSNFAISPMSFGVATFDGLDANGFLYKHGNSFSFPADSLTSSKIRLDSIFTGTPHKTTLADSIYFSFVYQPQGLGDKPEAEDSLVLEFFVPSKNKWKHIWSVGGKSFNTFFAKNGKAWKTIMIPIVDTSFFKENFQFRFRNYASYSDLLLPTWSSSGDFWSIDYIYINSERSKNDTIPNDLAFKERKETLLKNYYSMPWNHFVANANNEIDEKIHILYANNSAYTLNVVERIIVDDVAGASSIYNSGLSAFNLPPLTDTAFVRNHIPYQYNTTVDKNAIFNVKMCINTATISDPIQKNDTMAFYQKFFNYFSPDDGSAEAGYGLTVNGGKIAYKFKLNKPDTLRSVQMFFNKTINDVNQIYFYLTIWDDNNGIPGSVIYEQGGVRPEFEDGFNKFHNYILESPIAISGNIYVGWKQTSDEVLNLGYDKNTDRSKNLFYNVDGNWYNSLYAGTPMIRITVGGSAEPYIGIDDDIEKKLALFPNPCNYCNQITFSDDDLKKVSIIDINGRIIKQVFCNKDMAIADISCGFYTIMIEKKGKEPIFEKWILTK